MAQVGPIYILPRPSLPGKIYPLYISLADVFVAKTWYAVHTSHEGSSIRRDRAGWVTIVCPETQFWLFRGQRQCLTCVTMVGSRSHSEAPLWREGGGESRKIEGIGWSGQAPISS